MNRFLFAAPVLMVSVLASVAGPASTSAAQPVDAGEIPLPLPPDELFVADGPGEPPPPEAQQLLRPRGYGRDLIDDRSELSGAWLGVQLAPVPAALASHLKLLRNWNKGGVMVRNLFKDGPADKAGLDRYDVITAVDDKALDRGMEMFSRLIRSRKPGEQVRLSVYHAGALNVVPVTLGDAAARPDDMALKYEDDPDVARRNLFELRGKILRPGPDGWVLDDLGELPPMPQFDYFRGRPGGRTPKPETPDVEEGRRVDRQGNVLEVRREPDGGVTVRRYKTDASGKHVDVLAEPKSVIVKHFKNLDELRQVDPEAADLLASASSRPAESTSPRPNNWDRLKKGPQSESESPGRMPVNKLQEALRNYMGRYAERWNQPTPPPPNSPQWREWSRKFFSPDGTVPMPNGGTVLIPDRRVPDNSRGEPDGPQLFEAVPRRDGKGTDMRPLPRPEGRPVPQAEFDVLADGTIRARIRNGPTEVNMTFKNEQAMKEQAPKLYERYKGTVDRVR
jgi:hypothetical protein